MNINYTENVFNSENISSQNPLVLATYLLAYKIGDGIDQFYFPVLFPVGVFGNILSFLVMMQPHNRNTSFSVYISALAVSDTVVLLNAFLRYLNLVHRVEMPPNQHWYCTLFFIFVLSCVQCSTYFIVAMSFERFYSIIRPLNVSSFNTVKRAKTTIVCIVVFTFIYYSPHWFITTNHQTMCISNKYLSVNVYGKMYYWLSETISFVLPFMMLLVMNSVIIHTLRQRSNLNLMESEGEGQKDCRGSSNSDKQIYRILILVTFGYLMLSLPGKIVIFYLNIYRENTPQFIARFHLIGQLAAKTYYTNHGVNFFFYVFSGKKFRTDLKNLCVQKHKANIITDKPIATINTVMSSVID